MVSRHYAKAPFGAAWANYPDDSGMPEVQITNPAGGILGGDRLQIEVSLEPGSAATLLTQAASKVYRGEEASQRATFYVGRDAFLEYLPHHLIPYADSNYVQESTFHLEDGASLVIWDAYAAGRIARGESFAFERLSSMTRIFVDGLPEVVDGFDLPDGREPFGGYCYLGTVHMVGGGESATLAEEVHSLLAGIPGTLASASSTSEHLCTARILARNVTALYTALNATRILARKIRGMHGSAREVW